MPTGVDRFGAVVQKEDVNDSLYSLVADIQKEVEPLEIEVVEGLALIATVGQMCIRDRTCPVRLRRRLTRLTKGHPSC